MYPWTERSVRWYAAAVAYTGFDRALADEVEPYLQKGETVCDLGCGIGYLALELAARGYAVTAVDCDAAALAWLRSERQRRGLELEILHCDWFAVEQGRCWDSVVMVNAGRELTERTRLAALCRRRMFIVDRLRQTSHVRADGGPSARALARSDWAGFTQEKVFSLEFGQPLASLEDARAYVEEMSGMSLADDTLAALQQTGRADFPFYLPYRKEMKLLLYPSEKDMPAY